MIRLLRDALLACLVLGCATPTPTRSPAPTPSPAPTSPPAPVVTPHASDAPSLGALIDAALPAVNDRLDALQAGIDGGDIGAVRAATDALIAWATEQRDRLGDAAIEGCDDAGRARYSQGIDDVHRGAVDLSLALTIPDSALAEPEALERAISILRDGVEEMVLARLELDTATCPPATAVLPPSAAALDATSYLHLADSLRDRLTALRDRDAPPDVYARELLALEAEALAAIDAWGRDAGDLDALATSIETVRAVLEPATTVVSEDRALNAVRLAMFALIDQRAAADAVRARLGLPPTGPDGLL